MKLLMPYLPQVSVNHAYGQVYGKRFLKKEAAEWKQILTAQAMRGIEDHNITLPLPDDCKIVIELDAHFPRQRGRRPDGDNFLKLAQDAIANAFGIDDHICLAQVRSVEHNSESAKLDYEVSLQNKE